MTKLKLQLELPDRLAREAQDAGLLTSGAIKRLLQDAVRRRAGQALLTATKRATLKRVSPPLSLEEIQQEVKAVRAARKASKRA